jgi:hypothetical protein
MWIVSFLYWSEDPQERSTSFLTLISWTTRFSCCVEYSCQWLCSLWQFLTIISMLFGAISVPVTNTNARYCCLTETIAQLHKDFFWIQEDLHGQDSILTVLCLCTVFRILYKECNHTHDLTWMWVALDSCGVNNSPTSLISSWSTLSHQPSLWPCDLVQPLYNWKCIRGGLIIAFCHRVSVVLDHPVW